MRYYAVSHGRKSEQTFTLSDPEENKHSLQLSSECSSRHPAGTQKLNTFQILKIRHRLDN